MSRNAPMLSTCLQLQTNQIHTDRQESDCYFFFGGGGGLGTFGWLQCFHLQLQSIRCWDPAWKQSHPFGNIALCPNVDPRAMLCSSFLFHFWKVFLYTSFLPALLISKVLKHLFNISNLVVKARISKFTLFMGGLYGWGCCRQTCSSPVPERRPWNLA